jgi:hypothetical protein
MMDGIRNLLSESNLTIDIGGVSSFDEAAICVQPGRRRVQMRRESLFPFLPAVLAAVANIVATAMVRSNQPEHPGRFVVYQVVMFGAALSAAIPNKWVRFAGFVLVLAGMTITGFSVGTLYVPTFLAVVWLMVRDVLPSVQSGPGPGR